MKRGKQFINKTPEYFLIQLQSLKEIIETTNYQNKSRKHVHFSGEVQNNEIEKMLKLLKMDCLEQHKINIAIDPNDSIFLNILNELEAQSSIEDKFQNIQQILNLSFIFTTEVQYIDEYQHISDSELESQFPAFPPVLIRVSSSYNEIIEH